MNPSVKRHELQIHELFVRAHPSQYLEVTYQLHCITSTRGPEPCGSCTPRDVPMHKILWGTRVGAKKRIMHSKPALAAFDHASRTKTTP